MMNSLIHFSNLAQTILNHETRYQANKKIIQDIFKIPSVTFKDTIQFRLTVIDSYYSTQMSKRLYGIEDIAKTLVLKSDEELKSEISLFLKEPSKSTFLKEAFNKKYGINKQGKDFGKAISLLSKYCYFVNNSNFPIYDTIAKVSYPLLNNGKAINETNYFVAIKELNKTSGINNYEKLDNLMWLLGKIKSGSFSILMDIEKYRTITENIVVHKKDTTKEKDNRIRKHIAEIYKTSDIFSKDEKEFLEFAFRLNN